MIRLSTLEIGHLNLIESLKTLRKYWNLMMKKDFHDQKEPYNLKAYSDKIIINWIK